jgi:hypothetical protein
METMKPVELFDYGIYTEHSDIRAHVGVLSKSVFVFQTQNAITAIEDHKPKLAFGFQTGISTPTASGWLVALEWIKDLRTIPVKTSWSGWKGWTEAISTTERGSRAVELVLQMMHLGRFPLWLRDVQDAPRQSIQIKGTDIVIFAHKRVQVKCDFKAGPKSIPGCTGNLFIQKSERNPMGHH